MTNYHSYALNDIAILHLDGEVCLNEYVQPACLPNPNYGIDIPSSSNISCVYASGWVNLFN